MPAAPSHGLCRSAGELPSQSPSGDSSPEGRAKSRLPLWGRCPPKEGGEGNCAAVRERRRQPEVARLFPWFLFGLAPTKVKGKVETFLKKSFIKKLYARFARHSAARTSHCIYTMRNSGWLNSTTWPLPTQISATVPSSSAGISFISFMASMMHSVSPFFTWSPTSTKGRASGLGAE